MTATLKKAKTSKKVARVATVRRTGSPTGRAFDEVFARLRDILDEHAGALQVKADSHNGFWLSSPKPHNNKELFFGAAEMRKSYVSFYLFPVYMFPELLSDVSPELKKRMQGKSCFNFSKVDDALLAELRALTKRGMEEFRKRELV